jgi:DNA replication protein DnaC
MTPLEWDSRVADRASCTAPAYSANSERDLQALTQLLAMELRRGRHIVLWGPRGGGKTTLLQAVGRELGDVHHALTVVTSRLDDITQTLERAYAEVPEGFSDAASSVLKLWMSFYSDRVGKRKPILRSAIS